MSVPTLSSALDRLVRRHPALRTTLHDTADGLHQAVTAAQPVELDLADVSEDALHEREPRVARLVDEFVRRPFDLSADQLVRALLVRRSELRSSLVLCIHHLACDATSFAILCDELVAGYAAAERGHPIPPDGPVVGEGAPDGAPSNEGARSADIDAEDVRLGRLAAATLLPADRPRSLLPAGPGASLAIDLPAGSVDRLVTHAAGRGCTPFMALSAVFALLLGRWCARSSVLFTTPMARRDRPELERRVGFMVDTVPIAVDLHPARDLDGLLAAAREGTLAAFDRTFTRPPGETTGSAGVRAARLSFAVEDGRTPVFRMGSLRVWDRWVHTATAKFDLAVRVERTARRCRLLAEYATDVFDRVTVRRIAEHFVELVEAAARLDGRTVDTWPLLPAPERGLYRRVGCGTRRPIGSSVVDRIAAVVARTPLAPAIRTADTIVDYRTAWLAAGALGRALKRHGVRAGDGVAVCLPRSADLVIAVLAVLRAGAYFVPVDPSDPPMRRAAVLGDAGVRVVVGRLGLDLGGGDLVLVPPVGAGDVAPAAGTEDPDDRDGARPRGAGTHPLDLAYVVFTSGSTGTPKGVMVTHAGLANYLGWASAEYRIRPGGAVPLHTPVAVDLTVTSLLGPLVSGGTVCPAPDEPAATSRLPSREFGLVKATPTRMDLLLDEPPGWTAKVLVLGGENLTAEQVLAYRAAVPRARIVNEYGPTETVVGSTAFEMRRVPAGGVVPIGRPIANTDVHVVDAALRRLPLGVWGELVIGGVGVSRGYLGRAGATAERFVPDPFGFRPGARLYRTGDIARWSRAGVLELRGRLDDQVKVFGHRVEPGEIEVVLATAPLVRQAAVTVVGSRIVAFVRWSAPRSAAEPTDVRTSLMPWLRERLPAHLVPDAVVPVDRIPMTAAGKLDRSALAALAAPSRVPDARVRSLYEVVHEQWCAVLGADRLPGDLNFFDAGGTSLLLLRLHGALAAQGIDGLVPADLYRFPTISALAVHLADSAVPSPSATHGPAGTSRHDRAAARGDRRERLRRRHAND